MPELTPRQAWMLLGFMAMTWLVVMYLVWVSG